LNIGINTDNGVYVGENSSTYTVQKADLGYLITVTVTRANNSGTVTGSTTSVVKGEPLTILSGSVSITGDAEPGKTLTANTSSLGGSGTISYQWKRGVSTNIGVDSSTYIVQAGDVLSFITVTVTREGYYGSVTSVPAGPVTNPSLEPLTGTVSISGATQAGQTLTANTGSLGGSGDISYQWLKGVSGVGENRSTYILRNTDIGSVISVKVTRAGNSGFITSTATGIVTPDISHLPYFYTGTGKTYNGYAGGETGVQNLGGGLTITYPLNTTFEADAFFTLEGSVSNPGAYNYALISVWKDDGGSGGYQYLVNGDFKQQRIWLRNGPGEYSVYVSGLSSISLTGGGLPQSWSVATGEVSYKVTNTRNEDGRFIYPSPICMSDDPMITSLVTELTLGKTTERDKIKAIHDYMALNIAYDHASCVDGQRKRQDSVGVLGTKYTTNNIFPNGHYYAVCEGFANVFAALARAAGFQAKYISSGEMNHGWNQVYVDGAWRFMDVTWDGSQSWPITGEVNYDYYLLDEPENVHPGHWSVPGTTNAKPDPGRSVKVFGPLQNGVVEDW
ncbi:MAG: transglutaminase-like domain-containing protein, partial [Treponema sp.]|nr:transglutaminase-like domain-containing protein [Treponema sp.]